LRGSQLAVESRNSGAPSAPHLDRPGCIVVKIIPARGGSVAVLFPANDSVATVPPARKWRWLNVMRDCRWPFSSGLEQLHAAFSLARASGRRSFYAFSPRPRTAGALVRRQRHGLASTAEGNSHSPAAEKCPPPAAPEIGTPNTGSPPASGRCGPPNEPQPPPRAPSRWGGNGHLIFSTSAFVPPDEPFNAATKSPFW